MKTFDDVDGLFSVHSKGNKKTKKRFKIPGKSWSWVEKRNLMKFLMK